MIHGKYEDGTLGYEHPRIAAAFAEIGACAQRNEEFKRERNPGTISVGKNLRKVKPGLSFNRQIAADAQRRCHDRRSTPEQRRMLSAIAQEHVGLPR